MINATVKSSKELPEYYELSLTVDTGTTVVTVNPGLCTKLELSDLVEELEDLTTKIKHKI